MHQPPQNSTTRFSDRVDNYVRFRPTYPPAVVDILSDETGLTKSSVIADVGSGTGISSELFLKNGNEVYGIEPNNEMRQAAERLLASYPNFHSIAAQAEAITLPDASVDHVVAGQAFHWFDRTRTKQEFARILKPGGWAVLLWNTRRLDSTPFLEGYEALLQQYGTDYHATQHKQIATDLLRSFFAGGQDFRVPAGIRRAAGRHGGRCSHSIENHRYPPLVWPRGDAAGRRTDRAHRVRGVRGRQP